MMGLGAADSGFFPNKALSGIFISWMSYHPVVSFHVTYKMFMFDCVCCGEHLS
jgi:hypothetical protein